ncbi:MAG TPA: peptidoglycan-binding protein [Thermoanaerobaculia bacterium]|nr:peptidoglycan-binding protein [Thermoanaerobaculia bacterium]
MARVFFAKGAKGEIVRRMQLQLGFKAGDADGVFGGDTLKAVTKFQKAKGLDPTGEVDAATYEKLMGAKVPPVRDRALGVTASFEGHGFTLAQGNFDGAGITWGIIGFTLAGGELKSILLETRKSNPDLLQEAFGARTDQLLDLLKKPMKEQIAFADTISLGADKTRLAEPWRTAFKTLGEFQEVQDIQLKRVEDDYYKPALQTARKFDLKTELGLALAFDIHVQNGGVKEAARQKIEAALKEHPVAREIDLRILIAQAVADKASPKFRQDVLDRKLTLATGAGRVHGAMYMLRNWGVDDLAAEI